VVAMACNEDAHERMAVAWARLTLRLEPTATQMRRFGKRRSTGAVKSRGHIDALGSRRPKAAKCSRGFTLP